MERDRAAYKELFLKDMADAFFLYVDQEYKTAEVIEAVEKLVEFFYKVDEEPSEINWKKDRFRVASLYTRWWKAACESCWVRYERVDSYGFPRGEVVKPEKSKAWKSGLYWLVYSHSSYFLPSCALVATQSQGYQCDALIGLDDDNLVWRFENHLIDSLETFYRHTPYCEPKGYEGTDSVEDYFLGSMWAALALTIEEHEEFRKKIREWGYAHYVGSECYAIYSSDDNYEGDGSEIAKECDAIEKEMKNIIKV